MRKKCEEDIAKRLRRFGEEIKTEIIKDSDIQNAVNNDNDEIQSNLQESFKMIGEISKWVGQQLRFDQEEENDENDCQEEIDELNQKIKNSVRKFNTNETIPFVKKFEDLIEKELISSKLFNNIVTLPELDTKDLKRKIGKINI